MDRSLRSGLTVWVLAGLMACITSMADAQVATVVTFDNRDGSLFQANIEMNLSAVCQELNRAFSEKRQPMLPQVTPTARERFSALWNTVPFRISAVRLTGNLLSLPGGGYQFRGVPLMVRDENGTDRQESGVFNMDADGWIDDFSFGLEMHRWEELLSAGQDQVDSVRRRRILDFLEDFRTAYNRKDINLLENTFSENALIIMGKVIKPKPAGEGANYLSGLGKERVELIRMSKREYMTQLRMSFARNQFIDVRFSDMKITRHPAYKTIYGVSLRQAWRSSTYSDDGYLFVMIDFEDDARPIIHVRAWQPQKFTSKSDVIQLGEFIIFK